MSQTTWLKAKLKFVNLNVSTGRFRLQANTLALESFIWRGGNGHCDKGSCAAVQNEVHVLFHGQDLYVCSLRRMYSFLFFPFCQSFSMEAPYIPHAFPSQTVFDYLSQRTNRPCHFILDVMEYFLAGEDQQQTNQPHNLAGGQP